ncbi:MAG: ferredoxin--NADP reductase [Betaproteobacteria bacterium]|nr:MAG: ferredoxin--NADP reductase [Betaproteobacteria bacterium]
MSRWVEGRIVGNYQWTDRLVSLQVAAPEVTFVAGQFARLALPAPAGSKEAMLGRPYSFVNPPQDGPHEFYFNVLPEGPLSPRLARLRLGEPVWLLDRANGFFTVAELPAADALWCLATGTGLGPFLSMLRTVDPWEKFERVVLVHAVRYSEDLSYAEVMANLAAAHHGRFTFVPFVSRQARRGALPGRIPAAIVDGRLEAWTGVPLTAANAHAMLCGNPEMVRDTQAVLESRGMHRHRRREPGHFTLETYW